MSTRTATVNVKIADTAEVRRALEEASEHIDRLTLFLHEIQKHPDYDYCMTFEGRTVDPSTEGWERNPALMDAWHASPGADAQRVETTPWASREFYWMCRKTELHS